MCQGSPGVLASPIAAVPGLGTAPLTTFGAAPGGTLLSDTSQQYIGADMQICTAGSVAFSILISQGGIFNYACFQLLLFLLLLPLVSKVTFYYNIILLINKKNIFQYFGFFNPNSSLDI